MLHRKWNNGPIIPFPVQHSATTPGNSFLFCFITFREKFQLPFGELLDHVVALIDEHLNAETVADSSERGFLYLRDIGIVGRVKGVASAIGRRVGLSPVAG